MANEKIAVVEDDAAIRRVLALALKSAGYRVETADAGDVGLDLVQRTRPDLVLLDLMLPAARRALAGVDPAEVGGVVAVSFSAPERFPALAVRLQHELGLARDAAALGVWMHGRAGELLEEEMTAYCASPLALIECGLPRAFRELC